MQGTDPEYHGARLEISTQVTGPSYSACLGWMREIPDRPITLDFWARGNFIRRLLYQRLRGDQPFLVPAAHPNQMRWAFRRLALAGIPVDFVYMGPLTEPRLVVHWQPLDIPIDSGWGYIVGAGTIVRSKSDRKFWPVLGEASLMPESVLQWLVDEVPASFLAGRVFVAPAELIGIRRDASAPNLEALGDLTTAVPASGVRDEAMAVLDLEIPWIDGMSPFDFEALLADYQDDLAEFQSSFRSLVSGYQASGPDMRAAEQRLTAAAAELRRSARAAQLRSVIVKCKGELRSFPLAMGVLAAAGAAYARDPFAGAAVLGAAGKVLRDLWTQAKADARGAIRNPLRLLLRLGAAKPTFRPRAHRARLATVPFMSSSELKPFHWLCPPSGHGLRFGMFKKDE